MVNEALIENRRLADACERIGGAMKYWNTAPTADIDWYYGLQAHPDVTERVWFQLGSRVDARCRWLFRSRPVLVHPESGQIFAIVFGQQWGMRLAPPDVPEDRGRVLFCGIGPWWAERGFGDGDFERIVRAYEAAAMVGPVPR
jgi:hypothetical protein